MARINIIEAAENEPPKPDYIWPGFRAGTVGALFSPGGTGKSFWAIEAAMCVASARAVEQLCVYEDITTHGGVMYIAAEDPADVIRERLHYICKNLSTEAYHEVASLMWIEAMMGKRLNVADDRHLDRLVEVSSGARIVVIDTLSRVHTLDENSNGDMAGIMQRLEYLADQTGAAVLYLHHVNKAAALAGQGGLQQAARGASVLVDNARYAAALTTMDEDEARTYGIHPDERRRYVCLRVTKQNYGVPVPDRWYRRHDGGVLLPVQLKPVEQEGERRRKAKAKEVDNDSDF